MSLPWCQKQQWNSCCFVVREGQWLDIPASEVQAHNEKVKKQWESETSKLSADTNFQLPAATNKFGKIEGFSL